MKNQLKKLIACVLTIAFTVALTTGAFAGTKAKTAAKAAPFTFNVYLNYSWWSMPAFDETNKISKWIMDNEGFKINFSWPSGNETDKLNVMVATDNLPDVIVMDRGDMENKLVQLNKLVPLDSYIKKYTGYRSLVDQETINFSRINGHVYGMLNWPMSDKWLGFGKGAVLDASIYKKMGSPRLDTLADFEAYLQKVKNARLTVNGKAVVPLQTDLQAAALSYLWSAWGDHRTDAWNNVSNRPINNGKLALSLTDPKFPEYVAYVNDLYTKGLVNSDCFIETKEQITEKITNKRAAVIFPGGDGDLLSIITNANNEAVKAFKSPVYIPLPTLRANTSVNKNTIKNSSGATLGWNTVVITKNAKDPEKIYKALDWMASAEGQRVINFGPKGELYDKVDKNGLPILKPGASLQQTDAQVKVLPIGKFSIVSNGPWFDHAKIALNKVLPKNQQDWMTNYQSSTLSKLIWNATEFVNLDPLAGTPEAITNTDVLNYIKDARAKIIMAPTKQKALDNLKQAIDDIYSKGFKKVEDYENKKWQQNVQDMK